MNKNYNRIPEKVKKIHITAVCGTGMGALACMLKELGYHITGSDHKVYPPMSTFLANKGIHLIDGFKSENISPNTDLVIIGNAVRKDNPEAVATRDQNICFCSMPQALNHFVAKGKQTILITGTHGKTTTASLMAWLLFHAGLDPSFMIGGILQNFNNNYRLGKGAYMVIEGDEYDTAFFDKGPKFMHYKPALATLTSVEFDHADIFNDLSHVKQVFTNFVGNIPKQSSLVAYNIDSNINEVLQQAACKVERYGTDSNSFWRIENQISSGRETLFQVFKKSQELGEFKTTLLGNHNLMNILSVIALADHLKIPADTIREGLATFKGIKRRQEVRGKKKGITVMDDFAHHPTAVLETTQAVKRACEDGRLVAVFEPRTNTSMRQVFQSVYPNAFNAADLICIRKPPLLQKVPEGERFSSEQLVSDLKKQGKDAHYFADTESIIDFLTEEAKSGDIILIMSNGGFDNIHERLLEML
jgi:UDP-N-acetylmuramate: L-alanyl-gamma-D-glutamyl-meso-diaminopimelate ligase